MNKIKQIGRIAVVAMTIPLASLAAESGRDRAVRLNDEGVALVQKGKIKEAINDFKAAIDADVHYVEPAHNLGKLLIAAKQYALAEKILSYVVRENPDDMGSFVQIAQSAALRGDVETGRKTVERIAKGDKSLLTSLALLLSGQKSHELAEYAARRAVEEEPGNAEAWYNKGLTAQRSEKWQDAEEAYGKAVELKSGYVNALVNLGNVQDAQGKVDAAIASYEKAYAADADSSLALYNLGRMLTLKGRDPKRGLELLQAATRHGSEPGANAARELLAELVAKTRKGGAK
jgi:tetratricopeptide (TPR) repeat protein